MDPKKRYARQTSFWEYFAQVRIFYKIKTQCTIENSAISVYRSFTVIIYQTFSSFYKRKRPTECMKTNNFDGFDKIIINQYRGSRGSKNLKDKPPNKSGKFGLRMLILSDIIHLIKNRKILISITGAFCLYFWRFLLEAHMPNEMGGSDFV